VPVGAATDGAVLEGTAVDGDADRASPVLRAAVIDWDGALLDADDAVCRALNASTAEVVGEAFPASATDRAMVLQLGEPAGLRLLTQDPEVLADLQSRFLERYREAETTRPELRPGARAFLEQLRTWGLRTLLFSLGHPARVRLDLERLGAEPLFDDVLTAEDVDAGPPSPVPFELATAKLGLPASQVVFVGDSVEDVIGGRAAGLRVVALDLLDEPARFGEDGPWLVASAFEELTSRLASELAPPSEP
jgi:HAD superfamily hydrolase (TIGR01509 family)